MERATGFVATVPGTTAGVPPTVFVATIHRLRLTLARTCWDWLQIAVGGANHYANDCYPSLSDWILASHQIQPCQCCSCS